MTTPLTYNQEIAALKPHCSIIELVAGASRMAIAPYLQGRVLTSCVSAKEHGFGWVNHALIQSGKTQPKFNAYGGEDRIWLGPEAGKFGLFFSPGAQQVFDHWHTPACVDTELFAIAAQNDTSVQLTKTCALQNYQGTRFAVSINRTVRILSVDEICAAIPAVERNAVAMVAFESLNTLTNVAHTAWQKDSGLLNLWILGQFKTSPACWAILPTKTPGSINQNYFEANLHNRLFHEDAYSLFSVDGAQKAKIGLSPQADRNVVGSFDFATNTLTLVTYKTDKSAVFLNAEWTMQDTAYTGDVIHVFNDGPNEDGSILGPYYELETSSSSKALAPQDQIHHTHRTFHFTGSFNQLNAIANAVLHTDLEAVKKKIAPH